MKQNKKERKRPDILEEIIKEWEENPIVEHLEDSPIPGITKIEDIKDFQHYLAQKTIDYVKEHNLTDIDAVYFRFDGMQHSVQWGEWVPASDSYIKVEGIRYNRDRRKDGTILEVPYRYDIGEYY